MEVKAVVLAAGLGTRMKSSVPKMLHLLGGRPLISWTVESAREASGSPPAVIIGPESGNLREAVGGECDFILQTDRLGTGHAVLQASDALCGRSDLILILNGDMPLIRVETLRRLIEGQKADSGALTILSAQSDQSRGFGRILRNAQGEIETVIEEAHATPEQLAVSELNVGAYCCRAEWLWPALQKLPLSPKGEYYLTDLVGLARADGEKVSSVPIGSLDEAIGINTRVHLAQAEKALRDRINRDWMEQGVTMMDPDSTYVEGSVRLEPDSVLMPNTHLIGKTTIGTGCKIGPNTIIRDSIIGENCEILSSVIEGAVVEDQVEIGPFAHLREGAHLGKGVHMGNFGEVKNSHLEAGVKMGHFSYIGDAHIGENVNIGAGTITCNFDGQRKHHTEIGADAFIGSDTMLVAPLKIGRGARTGAGSVVTKDVPDNSLAVGVPARVIRKLE
ncbi:MAG: bifunctional UDP-N-acetylglucosamine diphosphorylase/glucosamine-1-phosphate N-acetyltransferase GlmU [Anaerolineales bacterium]